MGGAERRSSTNGRRASDRQVSAPTWLRLGLLIATLIIAVTALLAIRANDRPRHDVEAARASLLNADAALGAAEIEQQIQKAQSALTLSVAHLTAFPDRPLDALARARAVAPQGAFAVIGPDGRIEANLGGGVELFSEAVSTSPRLSADGLALLFAETAPGGRSVAARLPLDASILPASPSGLRRALTAQRGAIVVAGRNPAGEDRQGKDMAVATAAVGDTGLVVASMQPRTVGPAPHLSDIWLLIGPLFIGLLALFTVMFQDRRQKRARVKWSESERMFRVAVEAAKCGVWEWDLSTKTVIVSDYMAALLGLKTSGSRPADEVMDRIHPRYRDQFSHALRQAATFGAFEITFPVAGPDGRARWIDARGQSRGERGPEGFVHILGVGLDITEARRAKAQAQAAEGRLRDGIESVSDAFVLFDRQGRLILWNQAFKDAFGFSDDVVRRGVPKEDLNRIAGLAIRAERPSPNGRAGARELEMNDGRWLQMSERFTSDGGTVISASDITAIKLRETERQRAAEDLQATIDQLEASQQKLSLLARKYEVAMTRAEAANQAKSEFLANMSHELRTPLNAINGFSEIMAGEMFGPLGHQKYKGYAADILKSGQHLLSLINDVLDMSKIEAGKMRLHYETVSLIEVCEDAVRLMRGKIEEAHLRLRLDAPDIPVIEADQRAMKQVVLNLISNAVKFTPEGGSIRILVNYADEDHLRLSVTDTGIGIAADDLVRLARPFEQVEGQHSKTTPGTGLGLALTKSLIELHGGEMAMESEPGRGTCVSFTIPIQRRGEGGAEQKTAPVQPSLPSKAA